MFYKFFAIEDAEDRVRISNVNDEKHSRGLWGGEETTPIQASINELHHYGR